MNELRRKEIERETEREQEKVYQWIKEQPISEITSRQIDILVDRFVMDKKPSVNIHSKHPTSNEYPPQYATWEGVGLILKKLKERGQDWMENEFGMLIQQSTDVPCYGDDKDYRAVGELLFRLTPKAVVIASLKSVGIKLID